MWGQVKFHRQLQYGRQKCTTASKTSKFFSKQANYLGFLQVCILFCLPSVVTSVTLLPHVISMLWPVVFVHEDWLTATKQIFIQLTYACLFLLGTTSNLFLLSSYCLSKNKQKKHWNVFNVKISVISFKLSSNWLADSKVTRAEGTDTQLERLIMLSQKPQFPQETG